MTPTADATISALRSTHDELAAVVRDLSDEQLLAPVRRLRVAGGPGALAPRQRRRDRPGDAASPPRARARRSATASTSRSGTAGTRCPRASRPTPSSPRTPQLVAAYEALTPEQRSELQVALGFLPAPLPLASYAGMRLNEAAQHSWDARVAFDDDAAIDDDHGIPARRPLRRRAGLHARLHRQGRRSWASRPWSPSATSTTPSRSPTRSRWSPPTVAPRRPRRSWDRRMPSRA